MYIDNATTEGSCAQKEAIHKAKLRDYAIFAAT